MTRVDESRDGARKAGSLRRHERLIGPAAAVLLGAATAFFLIAMPRRILLRLIDMTGLPPAVAGAQWALALGVAALVGGATWALFRLLDRAPAPRVRPLAITHVAAPVLRRSDTHPDAPTCRPIFAGSDLGPPLDQADWRLAAGEGFTVLDTLELTEVVTGPVDPPPIVSSREGAEARRVDPIPPSAAEASNRTEEMPAASGLADAATRRTESDVPTAASAKAMIASPDAIEAPSTIEPAFVDATPALSTTAIGAIVSDMSSASSRDAGLPRAVADPTVATPVPRPDAPVPPDHAPPPLTVEMARLETALARKALALDGDAANVTPLRREIRPVDGSLRDAITAIERRIVPR